MSFFIFNKNNTVWSSFIYFKNMFAFPLIGYLKIYTFKFEILTGLSYASLWKMVYLKLCADKKESVAFSLTPQKQQKAKMDIFHHLLCLSVCRWAVPDDCHPFQEHLYHRQRGGKISSKSPFFVCMLLEFFQAFSSFFSSLLLQLFPRHNYHPNWS